MECAPTGLNLLLFLSNMLLSFLYKCVVSICCVASAHFSCLKACPDTHTVYTRLERNSMVLIRLSLFIKLDS